MFGISFSELLVIMTVILLVFGPKRMPEMARQLGKIFGQFRRTSDTMRKEFYNSIYPPDSGAHSLQHDLKSVKQEIETVTKDIKQASNKVISNITSIEEDKSGTGNKDRENK